MRRFVMVGTAILAAAIASAPAPATATPGKYTLHGDVLVTLATAGGCATATWPRGNTSTECGVYQVTQHNVEPGDWFGVSVKSYSGAAVSCSVLDIETGDRIYRDSAGSYETANCIRHATGSPSDPPLFGSSSS